MSRVYMTRAASSSMGGQLVPPYIFDLLRAAAIGRIGRQDVYGGALWVEAIKDDLHHPIKPGPNPIVIFILGSRRKCACTICWEDYALRVIPPRIWGPRLGKLLVRHVPKWYGGASPMICRKR